MHNADGIDMEYTTPSITPPIAITPEWLDKRYGWSLGTFGRGCQTKRLIAHIQCELKEIETAPVDLMEWVDLILLALDGAARAGHSSKAVINGIHEKHEINLKREWSKREGDEESPFFHVKQEEEIVVPDELATAVKHVQNIIDNNSWHSNALRASQACVTILAALNKKFITPMPEGVKKATRAVRGYAKEAYGRACFHGTVYPEAAMKEEQRSKDIRTVLGALTASQQEVAQLKEEGYKGVFVINEYDRRTKKAKAENKTLRERIKKVDEMLCKYDTAHDGHVSHPAVMTLLAALRGENLND